MIAICEWRAWYGFMAPALFPEAMRLYVDVTQPSAGITDKLPGDTELVLWQINLSLSANAPRGRAHLMRRLKRRSIRVINYEISDISRGHVQEVLRRAGLNTVSTVRVGDPDEILFVKTSLNSGGMPERQLARADRTKLGLSEPSRLLKHARDYQVLPRQRIPIRWWRSDKLAIERYISNKADRFWRAYVLGNGLVLVRASVPGAIKKLDAGAIRRNYACRLTMSSAGFMRSTEGASPSLLVQLHEFVRAFRLEFGALDIVEDDNGVPYIIDVNSTPYWGESQWSAPHGKCYGGMLAHLRACWDGKRGQGARSYGSR